VPTAAICAQYHTHKHTHTYAHTHARIHTHTRTHTHTHMHAHTHTHTHVHIHTHTGFEYCGKRASVPTAAICARNASSAFNYANATLRPLINLFVFSNEIPFEGIPFRYRSYESHYSTLQTYTSHSNTPL